MTIERLDEIRELVRATVEACRHHLDEQRSAALLEAAERGDLPAIHDLLVANMIELKGLHFTRRVLGEIDHMPELCEPRPTYLH